MSLPNDPNGTDWPDERERQKAFDRLERAGREPSVVDSKEERRLYELSRQGIDAPISPRAIAAQCPNDRRRHRAHEWTTGAGGKRWCRGIS